MNNHKLYILNIYIFTIHRFLRCGGMVCVREYDIPPQAAQTHMFLHTQKIYTEYKQLTSWICCVGTCNIFKAIFGERQASHSGFLFLVSERDRCKDQNQDTLYLKPLPVVGNVNIPPLYTVYTILSFSNKGYPFIFSPVTYPIMHHC